MKSDYLYENIFWTLVIILFIISIIILSKV